NPAGGDDGHRAVREFHARVGDVDVRRENRDARGPDLRHLRAHQLEDQVEIVNHQIEYHRDVGAARLERRQALRLQEPRLLEIRRRGAYRAVEPLDVAHLEAQPAITRRASALLRTGQRVCKGFFHQGTNA